MKLSCYAGDALALLAATIRAARIDQQVTHAALAERVGIWRALLARIERGEPGCAIGSVFEVAALLRVPLFGVDAPALAREAAHAADRLALLPTAARAARVAIDDNF